MSEGGIERRQYHRQSTDRQAQHKKFVDKGDFDKLDKISPVKPLKPGDRVVIREKAMIGTVRKIKGDSVSIHFEDGDGDSIAQVTRTVSVVRRAENYEKFLREQSQKGLTS